MMKHMMSGWMIALAVMLLAGTAGAANVWDGGGANANWDTPENWDDNNVPATGADVTFATGLASGTAISLNGDRTVNSLTINTNTTLSLNNNTLSLTSGDITVTVGGGHDINSAVDIGSADAVWDVGGTFNVNGNVGLDVMGNITSSGSLTKTGPGTLMLNGTGGSPDITGDVIAEQGLLTCRLQGSQLYWANSLTLSNATFYSEGANNLPATGDIRLYNGTINNKNSGTTRPNNVVLLGGNNTWNFYSSGSTLSGLISGGGAGTTFTIDADSGATIRFSNDGNSFTSKLLLQLWFYAFEFTSIANAGVNSALGAATGADATISTAGYVTFRYVGTDAAGHSTDRPFTTTQTRPTTIEASGVGPLTWNGTVYINGNEGQNGGTLGGTGLGILNGKLTIDNYDLKKTGTGTWILTAPNNDIGRNVIIQGGTLLANNATGSATGSGNVTVNNGGTLGGTGIVAGANHTVSVLAGGRLAPGNSNAIGTLTLNPGASGKVVISNAVSGASSGALRFDLGAPGTGDKIVITSGTFEIGTGDLGMSDFVFTDLGGVDDGSYTLIQNAGTLSGSLDAADTNGVVAGLSASLGFSGSDLILTVKGGNIAPEVDLNGAAAGVDYTTSFTVGGSAVAIVAADATVTDIDDAELASLTMIVNAAPDGAAEIVAVGGTDFPLDADKTATPTIGGTTFSVAYTAATRTFVAINNAGGKAAIGDVQTLLRGMTYRNTTSKPETATVRTITVRVNDGDADSLPAVSSITVIPTGIWDGGGANANWDTAENWNVNAVPSTDEDVTFATGLTSGTTINLNGNRTVNSLTLNTNATFSLNNNTLTLTSGNVTVTVGGNRDLNCNVDIGSTDAVWDIGGTPNADGNVGLDIQGNLISSGSLTKTGSGTLLLNRSGGMPDLTGDVIVSQGQLSCRYQTSQLAGAASLTVSNAAFYSDSLVGNLPATGPIVLHNATLQNKHSATRPNAFTLSGNNSLSFDNGSTLTGTISGGGVGTTLTLWAGQDKTLKLSNDGNSFTSKIALPLWFYVFEFTSIANAGAPSALGAPTGAEATIETVGYTTFRYVGTDPSGHATDRSFTTTQTRPTTIEASGAGPLTWNGTIYISGVEGAHGGRFGGTGVGIVNGKITIGAGGLRKNDSGTWVLTAPDNSIGGTSQVNAGTLRVNNGSGSGLGSSPVEVNAGGTLGGSGSLTGAVTVKGDATLTAGSSADSVGVLTLGTLTIEENATILCKYTDAANDRIDVTGTISLPVVASVVTATIEGTGYGDAVLISASAPITADVSGWTVTGPLDRGEIVIQGNQLILKGPPKGSLFLLR